MSAKALGLGNCRIDLDEVAIGFSITGHRAADMRNDVEREQVINLVETRHVDGRKLQAQEARSRLQNPIGFLKREGMRGTLRMPNAIV